MTTHLLDFLIPAAYAQASAPATAVPPPGGGLSFFVMAAIFFVFIYFAIWRPQNKRAKEQQSLLNSLAKGDEIITAGGLLGRIVKLHEHYVTVAVGSQAEIVMQKSAVISVLPKGTIKTLE